MGLGAMNKDFPTATPLWLKTTEAMGCNGTQAEKLICMRCEKIYFLFKNSIYDIYFIVKLFV